MKILFYFISFLFLGKSFATSPGFESEWRMSEYQERQLTGKWMSDTGDYVIEFMNTPSGFQMQMDSYSFHMMGNDTFPLHGVSISWPPHDCRISKINSDYIEVRYEFFGGEPFIINYRKLNE